MKLPVKTPTDPLYVIAVISNPRRYLTRYDLYRKFAKYIADSGAVLVTVETAFGDRPHEVTEAGNPFHVQLRTDGELWHKENMINIGLSRLPPDWKYVAWIDADVTFARPDWVAETIHKLQHHPVVQMFSFAQDLGPDFVPFASYQGFAATWAKKGSPNVDYKSPDYPGKESGHPGYAWAYTREAIDTLGGMLDTAICGAADRHMAFGLIGLGHISAQKGVSKGYQYAIDLWSQRAAKLKADIGYVEGCVHHFFHGAKKLRFYHSRWSILIDNAFDPFVDMHKDAQGLLRLSGNKPRLRDQLRSYFQARDEDNPSM